MLTLDAEDSDDSVDDDADDEIERIKMAMDKLNQSNSFPKGTNAAAFMAHQHENGQGTPAEVSQVNRNLSTTTQTPISLTQPLPLYKLQYDQNDLDLIMDKMHPASTFKIYENVDTQVNFPHFDYSQNQNQSQNQGQSQNQNPRLVDFLRSPQETVIRRRHQTHGTQTRRQSNISALNQQHVQLHRPPTSTDKLKLNPSSKTGIRAKTAASPSQSPKARNLKNSRISHPSNLITVKVKGLDDSYQCFKNADGNSGTIICTKKPGTFGSGPPTMQTLNPVTMTMPMPNTTIPQQQQQPTATGRKISLSAISRQKQEVSSVYGGAHQRPYSIKISSDVQPGVSASKCPLNLNAEPSTNTNTNNGQPTTILVMNKHNNNNNSSKRDEIPELPEWLRKFPNKEKGQKVTEEEDKENSIKIPLSRSQSRSRPRSRSSSRSRSPIKSLHYQSSTKATASKINTRTKSQLENKTSASHSPLRKLSRRVLHSSPSAATKLKEKVNLKTTEVQTIIHFSQSTQNAVAVAIGNQTAEASTNSDQKMEELKSAATQATLNLNRNRNRPATQPALNKNLQKKQSQIRNQNPNPNPLTIKKSTINNNKKIQSKTSNVKSSLSVNNKTGEGFNNPNNQSQKMAKAPVLTIAKSNNKIPQASQNPESQKKSNEGTKSPKSGNSSPKQAKNQQPLNSPASSHSPDPSKGVILNSKSSLPPQTSSFSSPEPKLTIESEFKKLLELKPPIVWIFGYTQVNTVGKVQQIIEALKIKLKFQLIHLDNIIPIWRKNEYFKNAQENSKEPRNLDLEDSICFHAKKILLKIKPNSMALATPEILTLLKLAMVSAQAHENPPAGFIISNFPVNSDEGERFQKFFYPFSAGLYFLDSAWSGSRHNPPKIIPPLFFQRNPPYSEFSVEKAADIFGAKTMKILHTEELDDRKMEDIVFIVTEHLQGLGEELRTRKKTQEFQKHKLENEQLKTKTMGGGRDRSGSGGNDQRRPFSLKS